jgi:hypothetical protein
MNATYANEENQWKKALQRTDLSVCKHVNARQELVPRVGPGHVFVRPTLISLPNLAHTYQVQLRFLPECWPCASFLPAALHLAVRKDSLASLSGGL